MDSLSLFRFFYRGPTCASEEALLDGTNPVPDSYFNASSEWSVDYAAHKARLGADSHWAPTDVDKDAELITLYLQVSKIYDF